MKTIHADLDNNAYMILLCVQKLGKPAMSKQTIA